MNLNKLQQNLAKKKKKSQALNDIKELFKCQENEPASKSRNKTSSKKYNTNVFYHLKVKLIKLN